MSHDPKDPKPTDNLSSDQPSDELLDEHEKTTKPPFERKQFGGSDRPARHHLDDDTPISKSDLKKGAQELTANSTLHIN